MADEVQANENTEEVKETAAEENAVEEKAPEQAPEKEAPAEEKAPEEAAAEEQAPAEEKAPEKAASEEAPESAPAPEKKKKINRLTPEELNKKIKMIEESGQVKSRYYKHLVQRKNEMEKASL